MYHTIFVLMDILMRIKQLRDERKWTNYRLCDEAGLPYVTITNMFSRGTQPSIATLTAICKAYGISLSQFFYNDEEYTPISDDERKMVNSYRQLSAKNRSAILNLMIALKE